MCVCVCVHVSVRPLGLTVAFCGSVRSKQVVIMYPFEGKHWVSIVCVLQQLKLLEY